MPVTTITADRALKDFYLEPLREQLNLNVDPAFAMMRMTSDNVVGRKIVKGIGVGVNGGFGASDEAAVPAAHGNLYEQFELDTKNLYGTIEISDKAIKATKDNAGGFANLLGDEIDKSVKTAQMNTARQFYGDGNGRLGTLKAVTAAGTTHGVDDWRPFHEGMTVDFLSADGTPLQGGARRRITSVTRDDTAPTITTTGAAITSADTDIVTLQGSYGRELTGLEAIFDAGREKLYGLSRAVHGWLNPRVKNVGGAWDELDLQAMLDDIRIMTGRDVDYIVCALGVRRAYLDAERTLKRHVNTLDIAGGFKALSYNGIPIYASEHVAKGTLYALVTDTFTLGQLGDWEWIDQGGGVLTRKADSTVYQAVLAKYCDILCEQPIAQGKLTGITEA
nr:phage major capsid protein [Maliibacterium massiliense]